MKINNKIREMYKEVIFSALSATAIAFIVL
jgi:hypothetical protein